MISFRKDFLICLKQRENIALVLKSRKEILKGINLSTLSHDDNRSVPPFNGFFLSGETFLWINDNQYCLSPTNQVQQPSTTKFYNRNY